MMLHTLQCAARNSYYINSMSIDFDFQYQVCMPDQQICSEELRKIAKTAILSNFIGLNLGRN